MNGHAITAPPGVGRAISKKNGQVKIDLPVFKFRRSEFLRSYLKKIGITKIAKIFTTLIMGFTAGPEVSL